jgi:tellurite resistance protein TerB
MSYQQSLGRFSKRSWEEVSNEVRQARDLRLMKGIVAGCALVAYADGWVTDAERSRMLGLIRGFEPIATFGLDTVIAAFEALSDQFADDPEGAERDALKAVGHMKAAQNYPVLLVETCCAIAAADGGFDAEERSAANRICEALGLDGRDFGIADAP